MLFWPLIFAKCCDYGPCFGTRGGFSATLQRLGVKIAFFLLGDQNRNFLKVKVSKMHLSLFLLQVGHLVKFSIIVLCYC